MTRKHVTYGEGKAGIVVSAEEPREGLYRLRLRRGAMHSAIRLWYGPPHDPDTGEVMDRSWRWQATAHGRPIDFDRVWPVCEADPIDQAEYDYLLELEDWGRKHDPNGPHANRHKPVDPLTAPLPF